MNGTHPRRRGAQAITLVTLALIAASRAAWAAQSVRLMAPGPIVVRAVDPPFSAACQPVTTDFGCTFPCPLTHPVWLVLDVAGYEPRRMELRVVPGQEMVDVNDGAWTPTPIAMTLQPPDFAATAQVVWVQEGEVATASPRAGNVTGPRVPPGEQFSVAIVGPEIKPVILSQQRVLAREPLAVQLESGSSAVIVCRDPWNGAVVPGCTVDLGTPSRALRTVANSKLAPHGQVTECGELRVLDLAKGSTQLLARAPGFAPTLRDVERLPSVADLPLEPAHELDIVLEDAANGRLIVGSVRVLQEVDDTALLVAAGGVEPGVQQPLLLAAGDYSIFAEAPGYRPTNVDVAVNKPHTRITVRLQKAVTVRGRVTDPSGTALPGAVVLAMTQHATFESMQNAATTDGGGQFQLTLPGEPPWSLFAKLAGYSSRPVTLTTASENVTLILERQCTVLILPLDAHSTPVRTETIVFMRPQTMEMVAANERTEDGWFRVQLAPGAWIAVIEDLGLQGRLTVPETCADWRGTLDLFAPNTQNAAPQH